MIELTLVRELERYLIDGIEARSLSVVDCSQGGSIIESTVELELGVDEKTLHTTRRFTIKVFYRKCPRCIAKAVGKHTHLVQIRFTSKQISKDLVNEIISKIAANVSSESIVDIKDLEEGVDIELDNATDARKILELITKYYSAKISSSFRPTRYDASSGRWLGVVTYVARIPIFREGDIVIYQGKIGIVKNANFNKILLEVPDLGKTLEVDTRLYWKGVVKHPVRVEKEQYIVKVAYDDKALIENTSTGEQRFVKLTKYRGLKPGERLLLIRADSIETIVRI
jgi:NMD protein affecting ribosome stability and mRNA decay